MKLFRVNLRVLRSKTILTLAPEWPSERPDDGMSYSVGIMPFRFNLVHISSALDRDYDYVERMFLTRITFVNL